MTPIHQRRGRPRTTINYFANYSLEVPGSSYCAGSQHHRTTDLDSILTSLPHFHVFLAPRRGMASYCENRVVLIRRCEPGSWLSVVKIDFNIDSMRSIKLQTQ